MIVELPRDMTDTKFEANGNVFDIIYSNNHVPLQEISKKAKESFIQNPNIDTVLYLAPTETPNNSNTFYYYVVERDGSFSTFCGNGAIASAKFLFDNKKVTQSQEFPNSIILKNKEGKDTIVSKQISEDTFAVHFDNVTNSVEDADSFADYLRPGFNGVLKPSEAISTQFKGFNQNPNKLNAFFPDNSNISQYDTYFASWITQIELDPSLKMEFLKFRSGLVFCQVLQAGGEPHTLIEMNYVPKNPYQRELFLKLASMMLRFQTVEDENTDLLYPQGMNFMFFAVNDAGQVTMYPAERGVYNGVDFDQTMACGTGSTCLGRYLLTQDSRFANQKSITIQNRRNPITIEKTTHGAKMISVAEKTSSKEGRVDFKPTTFTANFYLEKSLFYNQNSDDGIEKLAHKVPVIQAVRDALRVNGKVAVSTSIDHPNPHGFIDYYTAIGYFNASEIARKLQLPLVRTSLDTTGSKGANYPYASDQAITNSDEIFNGAKPQQSLLQFLAGLVSSGQFASIKTLDDFKKVLPNLIKDKFVKNAIKSESSNPNSTIEMLAENLITAAYLSSTHKMDEVEKYKELLNSYQEGTEVDLPEELRQILSNQVKKSMVVTAITEGLQEYFTKYASQNLSKEQRTNAFQTCIKAALLSPVFAFGFTPAQKTTLQETDVMNGRKYLAPDLHSISQTNKRENAAAATIFNLSSDLVVNFYTYACKQQNKSELTLFVIKGDKESKITIDKDGVCKIGKEVASTSDVANYITNTNNPSCVATSSVLYPAFAIGAVHHFGSERGYRKMFLDFASANADMVSRVLGTTTEELTKLITINKGLICDDYDPSQYSKPTPDLMPVATDNVGSGNPFYDLITNGTQIFQQNFQAAIVDPSKKTDF